MRNVKPVRVGDCVLNGEHIYIQSMLNARSDDIEGSVRQAVELEKAGCEIIRAAIPNMSAVKLIPAIKEAVKIPLVADIHFDYRLAIESAAAGVDKIRINPGNIGGMDRVKKVVDACRARNLPIRIGVNSGSLEKEILAKYGSPTPEALVESAMTHAAMLEHFDFDDIVISIKSSDVRLRSAIIRSISELQKLVQSEWDSSSPRSESVRFYVTVSAKRYEFPLPTILSGRSRRLRTFSAVSENAVE